LGEVMREQFRLCGSSSVERVAQGFADAAVKYQPPALQQIFISSVLNERVLETIVCIGW
jgi:hypothetical protein